MMFREQVATVSTWFDRWTPCEQTVAMVALLRRIHAPQARFLTTVLHRQLGDCPELRRAEILANDPNFIASLTNAESKETLVRDLLAYLPLLNPKNADVKSVYLALIPKVLKYTVDHCTLIEESRQLLSYSLIHPAFTVEDRGLFTSWLHQFEEKLNGPTNNEGLNPHYPTSLSGSPPSMHDFGSWQQNNSPPNNNPNSSSLSGSPASQSGLSVSNFAGSTNIQRIRRSNSLTPPVIHSDAWNSQEELCSTAKPRSLSLSSEVSPQSSLASSGSGSESHLDDPRPTFTSPGMREIPSWLKSLRLHKYSFLFAHLTFEEMLGLNEERLEKQGVTKGARHKIVLSIAKLRERPAHLKQLHDEMTTDKESVRNALTEVKWMLTTPIKPFGVSINTKDEIAPESGGAGTEASVNVNVNTSSGTSGGNPAGPGPIGSNRFQSNQSQTEDSEQNPETENDLAASIVKLVGKACELNPDMECEGLIVSVLDKCLSHDAFTPKQKRVLSLWRQQQAPIARRNSNGHHPHFHHHRTSSNPGSGGIGIGIANKGNGRHFSPRVLNLSTHLPSTAIGSGSNSWSSAGNSIHAMFMAKRPSLQDSILESVRSPHLSVQRTKSAPLPNFFASLSSSPPMFDHLGALGLGNQTTSDILAGLNFGTDAANNLIGGVGLGVDSGMDGGSGSNERGSGSGSGGQQSSAMDITSRLESLCLSMTEAALGPAFNSY